MDNKQFCKEMEKRTRKGESLQEQGGLRRMQRITDHLYFYRKRLKFRLSTSDSQAL